MDDTKLDKIIKQLTRIANALEAINRPFEYTPQPSTYPNYSPNTLPNTPIINPPWCGPTDGYPSVYCTTTEGEIG